MNRDELAALQDIWEVAEVIGSKFLAPDFGDDDRLRVLNVVLALLGGTGEPVQGVVEEIPYAKSRARFSRTSRRAYRLVQERQAEQRLKECLRPYFPAALEGNVAAARVYFRPTRQRIDVDNMAKAFNDGGNGLIFQDDGQVTLQVDAVALDPERPRTLFAISPHISSLSRGSSMCSGCGRRLPDSRATQCRACYRLGL